MNKFKSSMLIIIMVLLLGCSLIQKKESVDESGSSSSIKALSPRYLLTKYIRENDPVNPLKKVLSYERQYDFLLDSDVGKLKQIYSKHPEFRLDSLTPQETSDLVYFTKSMTPQDQRYYFTKYKNIKPQNINSAVTLEFASRVQKNYGDNVNYLTFSYFEKTHDTEGKFANIKSTFADIHLPGIKQESKEFYIALANMELLQFVQYSYRFSHDEFILTNKSLESAFKQQYKKSRDDLIKNIKKYLDYDPKWLTKIETELNLI